MNTDISGIGVRISFYLQTLFLGFLSARSGYLHEISGALYTLMATNMATALTAFILGLKPEPAITFHDALVILYLLTMSWVTVISSLASCSRFSTGTQVLQLFSVVQSYTILALALVVLSRTKIFGSQPECNQHAVVVIFRPFPAMRGGHIFGWIVTVLLAVGYTIMTVRDYTAQAMRKWKERRHKKEGPDRPVRPATRIRHRSIEVIPERETENIVQVAQANDEILNYAYRPLVDDRLLVMLFFILLLWVFFVLNTELLIRWNHFAVADGGSPWGFGQILPMFLTILPCVNAINAFREFRFRPTKQVDSMLIGRHVMVPTTIDTDLSDPV